MILCLAAAPLQAQQETVVGVQVHGNTLTPEDDIVQAAGIKIGSPYSDQLLSEVEARLRKWRSFDSVDVLKRFSSISDLTRILIVIQVDEGPVQIGMPPMNDSPIPNVPGTPTGQRTVVKRSRLNLMFMPILTAEDGYGLTYGAQFAITGHRRSNRRVVVPASWGGDKRIAAEFQQEIPRRFAPRLIAGGMLQRRTHPFFEAPADRGRIWGRAEWRLTRALRVGAEVARQTSTLQDEHVNARSFGSDFVIDTRVDPFLPHHAVFVQAGIERLAFASRSISRREVDATGYVGLNRGMVLALRAVSEGFSGPAPTFYKAILGGSRNLRGFRAGHAVGDTLLASSAELRVPFTSALRVGRFGGSVFVDAGTVYDHGARLKDQKWDRGIGGGFWATAPLFRISLMVARGLGSGTRVHFGAGLNF